MATQLTEKEFVSNFLTLATIHPFKYSKDYFKPYEDVEQLGVALPALPCKKYKYQPRSSASSALLGSAGGSTENVELSLKSVRPPKFSISKEFRKNQSIHAVKEFLVSEVEELVETQQLKVLLKGKVLHDSYILSDLSADSAALTVMVSKPSTPAATKTPVSTPSPVASPAAATFKAVEMPWTEIEELLKIRFGQDAATYVARLQKGWELTK
ncbi:hypothetical protein ACO0QE_000288 [Hanseniaspora vineae]